MGEMELNRCPVHDLILKEVETEEGKEFMCLICHKQILDFMYNCDRPNCNFFIHKKCAKLSKITTDLMHPHPLHLSSLYLRCNICSDTNWVAYKCHDCKFVICFSCFFTERMITHPCHEHALTIILRKMRTLCDACGTEEEDLFYICHICPFFLHKSCASLPSTFKCADHTHPLALVMEFSKLPHYTNKCDLCDGFFTRTSWVYYCGRCRYLIHVKCRPAKSRIFSDWEHEDIHFDHYLLKLPIPDNSVDLITSLVEHITPHINSFDIINIEQSDRKMKINHWSHDQHPMNLFDVQNNFDTNDEKILCDGCVQHISLPFYSCYKCNYFLHLSCANLPRTIQRPIHPGHSLECTRGSKFYTLTYCSGCETYTNGFFYDCRDCDFRLDIQCAFLPSTILHKSHHRPLLQIREQDEDVSCNGCNYDFSSDMPGFNCDKCKFSIDYKCALLPGNISHRWDKHPLILSYPPFSDHPEDFYCEFCEEEINPRLWMYHCSKCDHSFHPKCIQDQYSNVKYGGTLQVDDHPHPLIFTRKAKKSTRCCKCFRSVTDIGLSRSGAPIFECLECSYTVCTEVCLNDSLNSNVFISFLNSMLEYGKT